MTAKKLPEPRNMPEERATFYVTTPIYYVNDRPHIGHVYTTTLADVVARYHRLRGDDTFFLTGTDEHAAKVVDAAREHDLTPREWAQRNADEFRRTFARLAIRNDDFVRTSEPRHADTVSGYVRDLIESGNVYQGEYEGWYDAGQEEYVPETKARDAEYRSVITGKPLLRKREKNYFFRLSDYADRLLELIESGDFRVRPDARRNEVVARIREGLNDVPISRTGTEGWGIPIPGDPEQTIYVWIDALFSYLSTVDTPARRRFWPAQVHLIGKEILWFHAVIWPALLLALGRSLPEGVYAHSFWIREGQKMSKSLGNFVDLEEVDDYVARFGVDALRYYLVTQGPLGTSDADFAASKFIEVYNADLANTLGNSFSRVAAMTARYFDGVLPASVDRAASTARWEPIVERCLADYAAAMDELRLEGAAAAGLELVREVDGYIERTQPFRVARDPARRGEVATILYACNEALRIASVLLWPIMPERTAELWTRIGKEEYSETLADAGTDRLREWTRWGGLKPGTEIRQADALFPRYSG